MHDTLPLENRTERLTIEKERLEALPNFLFSLEEFNTATNKASGVIHAVQADVLVEIFFPPGFPYERPRLHTEDATVKGYRHVNRFGEICTLRYEPDDWEAETYTAADLIQRAWALISNRGELKHDEDDGLPIALDFLISKNQETPILLTPEDAVPSDTASFGQAFLQPAKTRRHGHILVGLKDQHHKQVWQDKDYTDQRQTRYSRENTGSETIAWFRATTAPPYSLVSLSELEALIPDGMGLKELMRRVGIVWHENRSKTTKVLVQFNDETGDRWAFVAVTTVKPVGKSPGSTRLEYCESFPVGEHAFFGRIAGLISREKLGQAKVALIGCGAVGSLIAFDLMRSGLGKLVLFDQDTVGVGNPVRSQLKFMDLSKHKVECLKKSLEEHLPYINVEAHPISVLNHDGLELFTKMLNEKQFDLVIVAVGRHGTSRKIDSLLKQYSVSRIHTWTTRGAAAGAVLVTSTDGFTYSQFHNLHVNHLLPQLPEDDLPNVIERGCNAPILPATPLDVGAVANHATRVAVQLLEGKQPAIFQCWTREPAPGFPGNAWITIPVDKTTSAAYISNMMQPLTSVQLSIEARLTMTEHVQVTPITETGGLIFGEIENGRMVIRLVTGPGKRAWRTRTGFAMDVEYAQGWIDAVAAMNKRLRWLGEWHSHPGGSLEPSNLDLRSLATLARAPNANLDAPVILIVNLEQGTFQSQAFTYDPTERYKDIPVEIEGSDVLAQIAAD